MMRKQIRIEIIFAVVLFVPISLGLIGYLFGLEGVLALAGYLSILPLLLMIAAFVANFRSMSSLASEDSRRKRARRALDMLKESPSASLVLTFSHDREIRISRGTECYRVVDSDGQVQSLEEEDVVEIITQSRTFPCFHSAMDSEE